MEHDCEHCKQKVPLAPFCGFCTREHTKAWLKECAEIEERSAAMARQGSIDATIFFTTLGAIFLLEKWLDESFEFWLTLCIWFVFWTVYLVYSSLKRTKYIKQATVKKEPTFHIQ